MATRALLTRVKVRENSEVNRQRVREKADVMTIMMTMPEPNLLTKAKPKAQEAAVLLKVRAREEVIPQGLAARVEAKVKAKAKTKGADHHQKAVARVARSHVPSTPKAFAPMVMSAGTAMMENLPRVMPHLPNPLM